jgi:hypothetical protein
VWVVINSADLGLLPFEEFELFPDIFALGNEADLLDEGDNIARSDLVVVRLFASRHAP